MPTSLKRTLREYGGERRGNIEYWEALFRWYLDMILSETFHDSTIFVACILCALCFLHSSVFFNEKMSSCPSCCRNLIHEIFFYELCLIMKLLTCMNLRRGSRGREIWFIFFSNFRPKFFFGYWYNRPFLLRIGSLVPWNKVITDFNLIRRKVGLTVEIQSRFDRCCI